MNALIDSRSVRTLMNGKMYESLNLCEPTRSAPDLVTLTGTTVPTGGGERCMSGQRFSFKRCGTHFGDGRATPHWHGRPRD